MSSFASAFWAESLKARRSWLPLLSAAAFAILPLVAGLFMLILKDPERARTMGLISAKAQLAAGVADWPTYFGVLTQGMAVGGGFLFAFITAWVFGREFSDFTAKELLAVPTPRWVIVAAKFALIALWILVLTIWVVALGIGVGAAVDIPGWTLQLGWASSAALLLTALLSYLLMPFVALWASLGRGYLPALGWAFLTIVLAQVAGALGWGDRFPWAVPALFSELAGPRSEQLGVHSYVLVTAAFVAGVTATWHWWRSADQA